MSDDVKFLETPSKEDAKQYGVKGMKWGIRNDRRGKAVFSSDGSVSDKQGDVKASIHKEAKRLATISIKRINEQPRYRLRNLNKPENKALKSEYDSAIQSAIKEAYTHAPTNVKIRNTANLWSGVAVLGAGATLAIVAHKNPSAVSGLLDDVKKAYLSHENGATVFLMSVERNANGLITTLGDVVEVDPTDRLAHDSLKSSEEASKKDAVQYGVKGMKWGVRKDAFRKAREKREAENSSDHRESRKIKKTPTRKLTNKQIETANKRLQLEKTLAKLKSDQRAINRGHNAVKAALTVTATASSIYAFANSPLGQEIISKGKSAVQAWLEKQ